MEKLFHKKKLKQGYAWKRKLKLSGSNLYPKNSFFNILLYLSPCNHKEDPEEFPSVHPKSYQSVLRAQD